ncbi:MAG: hypothetical protein P4L46_01300 [Fimbriimonas sp.]|nr:hypothetical protein [Fimbriimonas sp.]
MKRTFRSQPMVGDYLATAFIILGVLGLLFARADEIPPLASAWAIVLGGLILAAGRIMRFELDDSRISQINVFGKAVRTFAWTEIEEFKPEGGVRGDDDHYFKSSLVAKGQTMSFRDDMPQFDEIVREIRLHAPQVASAATDVPLGRPPAKLRANRHFAIWFVVVWLVLFVSFAHFGQTSVRHQERLYRDGDRWVVRYTFHNDANMNSVDFDIEKTYLNGKEAITYPQGLTLKHGTSGTVDVAFDGSAAKVGAMARLHSWWQWHLGNSSFRMQAMDVSFEARDEPLPK